MYLGALHGVNCKGFAAFSQLGSSRVWSQAMVNELWQAAGYELPAPVLPASMVGKKSFSTSGAPTLMNALTSKVLAKKATPEQLAASGIIAGTDEEKRFLNFWHGAMIAPCQKKGTLEKVVEGAFAVAGAIVPVVGLAKGAVDYTKATKAAKNAEQSARIADEVMTEAYAAQDARDAAAFDSQMNSLRSLVPVSTAQTLALKSTPAPRSSTLSQVAIFGAIAAGVFLLGVARR